MQKSPETQAFDANLSQQRIDYEDLPDGSTRALLTVTLPGGQSLTFVADGADHEDDHVSGVWDELEYSLGGDPAVEGIFGDIAKGIGKGIKAVGKVAKKVATSKVFKIAAKGLALAAPALGPMAPAAMTVAAGMGTASKLFDARRAAEKGNKQVAAALIKSAQADARKVAPKSAAKLIKIAQDKSRAAFDLSSKAKAKPAARKSSPKLAAPVFAKGTRMPKLAKPASAPSSAKGGKLTEKALIAAARKGRVYVVQAS